MKLGSHLILELGDCKDHGDVCQIEAAMIQAAKDTGATVLSSNLHSFGEGYGVTGVVILAESHLTIHTWPEHGYAAVDVFVCGDCDPMKALPALIERFKPLAIYKKLVDRGF